MLLYSEKKFPYSRIMPVDTNKWTLFVITTLIMMILWAIRVLKDGSLTIAWNPATKRLGVLAIATTASLLVSSNRVEAILTPLGSATFVAFFILALTGGSFLSEHMKTTLRWTIMTTVSLLGLLAVYQFVGLGDDPLWTPVGTSMGLIAVILVTMPSIVHEILHRKRSGHDNHMIIAIVMGLACIAGVGVTAYQILPKVGETMLPYWVNWQILLESYKDWRRLLIGVGAENFLAAFTQGRPASLNMTPLWNTRFTMGSSLAFHIATVYGFLGALAFSWFLTILHPVAILAFLFLPPSFSALVVVTAFLILSEPHLPHLMPKRFNLLWLRYPLPIVVLLLVGMSGYGLVRAYGGELAFARSLSALEARDGTKAYNLQIEAITKNPRITRFHTAYSQTNLALANAIAENSATGSADRETATQLVQQAIREAKIGVNLSPTNILAWENIANVYQALTGVAQGADQWTVAAYSKAIQLDPTNPVMRLRLGGAYVGQQKLDLAAESYAAAVALKSDYANAYYNLAFVYREQKKYLPAAQAIKDSLKYVTNPEDVSRAQAELTDLTELLTEEEKLSLGQLP